MTNFGQWKLATIPPPAIIEETREFAQLSQKTLQLQEMPWQIASDPDNNLKLCEANVFFQCVNILKILELRYPWENYAININKLQLLFWFFSYNLLS